MADAVKSVTDAHLMVVFSSSWCPYCKQVMQALQSANIDYHLVEVDGATKRVLMQKTGKSSVPSVWIGDKYIGGCNDGPEKWMGTIPNIGNGNVKKWMQELERERSGSAAGVAKAGISKRQRVEKPKVAILCGPDYDESLDTIDPTIATLLEDKVEVLNYKQAVECAQSDSVQGIISCNHASVDADLLDRLAPNGGVKVVSNYGVGVDHINLEDCKKRNIPVGHTPNVLSE
jgi:glutaredoxin